MSTDSSLQRGVPALDRAMELLAVLEEWSEGCSIKQLVELTGLARATVYRSVNSLADHGLVQQVSDGRYVLGSRLLTLANAVPLASDWVALSTRIRPTLRKLRDTSGESSKLSILRGDRALCIACAPGIRVGSLAGSEGQSFPLHAGAASKVLLAHAPETLRKKILEGELAQFTASTITDPQALGHELEATRRDSVAFDRGEFMLGVHAVAAPVECGGDVGVAALSVTFLGEGQPDGGERIKEEVMRSAASIARRLQRAG